MVILMPLTQFSEPSHDANNYDAVNTQTVNQYLVLIQKSTKHSHCTTELFDALSQYLGSREMADTQQAIFCTNEGDPEKCISDFHNAISMQQDLVVQIAA